MSGGAVSGRVAMLDSARRALVDDHRPLVTKIVLDLRELLCPTYSFDDACQDGWLALVDAARLYDPNAGPFAPFARPAVRGEVLNGRRRALGRPRRGRYRMPASLDVVDAHGVPLVDALTDPTPGPDAQAAARLELTAAVAAGRASCRDRYDTVVLAWMLDLADTRTQVQLAADFGIHPQRVHTRHRRLVRLMARAAGAAA